MNNTKRATLIWSLGAVIFSLIGVYTALTSDGVWYLIGSAILLILPGAVFASKAILTLRAA
ncbi:MULTISPECIES: hypothetical protein [unclassified Arthrobacter]|uniref:hypothetical protein n=1 Tax=unclassified Arthrobacter TaxID=235627 RepID=UPI001491F9BC|nr:MULTISPECIES: hypothetical protein [unclassified Arthrobacter]NOJ64126.1 hypothetical protein [Arthrobacter sp. 147(2020)]